MEEIEKLIMKMFDDKREEFLKVLKESFVRELCYLSYDIMMRKADKEDFSAECLFQEFLKELDKR
jgi:hypothetical protein